MDYINIIGTIFDNSTEHTAALASQVKDLRLNKKQQDINQEVEGDLHYAVSTKVQQSFTEQEKALGRENIGAIGFIPVATLQTLGIVKLYERSNSGVMTNKSGLQVIDSGQLRINCPDTLEDASTYGVFRDGVGQLKTVILHSATSEEINAIDTENASSRAAITPANIGIAVEKASTSNIASGESRPVTGGAMYTKLLDYYTKTEADAITNLCVTRADYNSSTKRLRFYNGDTWLFNIDATPFIKDGMVNNVEISNGNLVVTFNTDSGLEPISIPLTDIFNPSNYYTKTEINNSNFLSYSSLTLTSELLAQARSNIGASGIVPYGTQDVAGIVRLHGRPVNGVRTNKSGLTFADLEGALSVNCPDTLAGAQNGGVYRDDSGQLKTVITHSATAAELASIGLSGASEAAAITAANFKAACDLVGWTDGGIVYDISVAHPDGQGNPTPYADLAAALGTGGANVPEGIRKGGMSVKFIKGSAQSSDNKYVQFRLTSNSFLTDTAKWASSDVSDELKEEIEVNDTRGALDRIVLDVDYGFNKTKVVSAVQGTALTYTDDKIEINIPQGTTFNIQLNDASSILGSGNVFLYIKPVNGSWVAPSLLYIDDSVNIYTTNQDLEAVSFATAATNVLYSGNISFKIWKEDIKPSVINERIGEALDNVGVVSAQQAVSFLGDYDVATFANNVNSAIIGGDMSKPRYERNFNNSTVITTNQITDEFLASKHLSYIFSNDAAILSGNPITIGSMWYYGENYDEICSYVLLNKNKYIRVEFYVYSAHKDFPTSSSLQFYSNGLYIKASDKQVADTTSEYVKKVTLNIPTNNLSNSLSYLSLEIGATASNDYNIGEFGFTGLKVGFFEDATEASIKGIIGDWELPHLSYPIKTKDFYSKYLDVVENYIKLGTNGKSFNHVKSILESITLFTKRYKNKYVDEYNRLVVSFNGDSIFSAQLSFVEDAPDKSAGTFPPNMSKMIMARLFYDRYKFNSEDTVFRNITNSNWTKVGFDISNGDNDSTQTFNEIEVYGCTQGDYAQINVSGFHFIKVVWSEYKGLPFSFEVQRSADNGATYSIVDTINVTASDKKMVAYKIYTIEDTSLNYIYKIVPTSNYNDVCFWGVEMWNNPRLDVVVEAVSGSTAEDNYNHLGRFYDNIHKPALILMDIFALNDHAFTVNDWMHYLAEIFNYIKEHNIPLIAFNTHNPTATRTYPNFSIDVAKNEKVSTVNILEKYNSRSYAPTQAALGSDGLHLNTYGNQYYFEELKRIFDDVLLTLLL